MKKVFVVGAGASHDCGLPLGKDLVWNLPASSALFPAGKIKIDPNPDFLKFLNHFENYPEVSGQIKQERKNYADQIQIGQLPWPLLTEKRCYIDELFALAISKKDSEGLQLLTSLVIKHIHGISHKANCRQNAYKDFMQNVLPSCDDTTIISFNFDTLLREDIESYYDNKYSIAFDYLIDFDHIHSSGGRDKTYKRGNKIIPLIKLHGSLDWLYCQKCNSLTLDFFNPTPPFNVQSCQRCKIKGALSPLLVMPSQNMASRLNVLWETAKSALQQADQITVIGYSFPEYDKKARTLFSDNLSEHTQLEVIEAPTEETENLDYQKIMGKFSRLFPQLKKPVRIQLKGFIGYIEEWRSLLKK